MAIDPIQVALGAAFGFATTGLIRWWQYRRDLWLDEIKRFCDTLDDATDCATEYWIRAKVEVSASEMETEDKSGDEKIKALIDMKLYEARLLGFQTRLDGLSASVSARLIASDRLRLQENMTSLSDSLTGGNYKALSRDPDPDRVQLAQLTASEILIDLRRSLARALSFRGTSAHYWEAFRRKYAETRITDYNS